MLVPRDCSPIECTGTSAGATMAALALARMCVVGGPHQQRRRPSAPRRCARPSGFGMAACHQQQPPLTCAVLGGRRGEHHGIRHVCGSHPPHRAVPLALFIGGRCCRSRGGLPFPVSVLLMCCELRQTPHVANRWLRSCDAT